MSTNIPLLGASTNPAAELLPSTQPRAWGVLTFTGTFFIVAGVLNICPGCEPASRWSWLPSDPETAGFLNSAAVYASVLSIGLGTFGVVTS